MQRLLFFLLIINLVNPLSASFAVTYWAQVETEIQPPARFHHSMAFDSSRNKIVMFGGNIDGQIGDGTWEFDLKTESWAKINTTNEPPGVNYHAMVYDTKNQVVIMYGGVTSQSVPINTTWVYDGVNWRNMQPVNSPGIRRSHAMVYDPVNDQVILFGGIAKKNGVLQPMNDTWVYSYRQNTWQEVTNGSAPSPRHTSAMTYDSDRSRVVLFGGNVAYHSGHNSDTWVYDPESNIWEQVYPQSVISPPRGDFDMEYIPVADGFVLFGGYNKTNYFSDTWFLDSTLDAWIELDVGDIGPRGTDQSLVATRDTLYFYGYGGDLALSETWKLVFSSPMSSANSSIPLSSSVDKTNFSMFFLCTLVLISIKRRVIW